jgi:hypothetical protein
MSFVMRPRVLLIDELSLGLAPAVVGQLLPIVRADGRRRDDRRARGAERERGAHGRRAGVLHGAGQIRFDGPTAELLERPDLLRSVFLAGAIEPAGHPSTNGRGGRAGREIVGTIDRTVEPVLSVRELACLLRWHPGGRRRDLRRVPRRDRRDDRAERRGQDDGVRPRPGSPRDSGRSDRWARRHDDGCRGARPARARPVVPGRPSVPRADRAARPWRSLERFVGSRSPVAAALHLPMASSRRRRSRSGPTS